MEHTMESLINWCRVIGYTVRDAVTAHPTESTLIEIALTTENFISNMQLRRRLEIAKLHTRNCRRCKKLLSEINETLQHIDQDASATERSITWSSHYHFKQRSQILHRIDGYLAPPATVLNFPSVSRSSLARLTPVTVCLVMICAVSPFLGIAARQSVVSSNSPLITTTLTPGERLTASARSAATSTANLDQDDLTADEQLMTEVEYAIETPRVSPIMVLDELTPRLRESSVTVR